MDYPRHRQYFIAVCRSVLDEWMDRRGLGFTPWRECPDCGGQYEGTDVYFWIGIDPRESCFRHCPLDVQTGLNRSCAQAQSIEGRAELSLYRYMPDRWEWKRQHPWPWFSDEHTLRDRLTAIRDELLDVVIEPWWNDLGGFRDEIVRRNAELRQELEKIGLLDRLEEARRNAKQWIREQRYEEILSQYGEIPTGLLSELDHKYLRMAYSRLVR